MSRTQTYSAAQPAAIPVSPYTSSPGLNNVTSRPTLSTRPANSVPGTGCRGFPSPVNSRPINGRPCRIMLCAAETVVA